MSLAIAWMGNANRLLLEDLKKERDQSHLLLSELQHRGKNSLMVLQAIASQTLKDEKESTAFLDRLNALATLDAVRSESQRQQVQLQDIARKQLQYFAERISI